MLKVLKDFIEEFKEKEEAVHKWLESKRAEVEMDPIYTSVDLRNGGFKVVPVDTNLFPGGWNNLCPMYGKLASEMFKRYFDKYYPSTKCLLILPEDHTRNSYYFSNIKRLQDILFEAGFDVKIGSLNPEVADGSKFLTAEDEEITMYQLKREEDAIYVDKRRVCRIIVNNDFSSGIPEILQGIKQEMIPSPKVGWHTRRKSRHFEIYENLVKEFADILGIDYWHFNSQFSVVNDVNFDDESSRKKVAAEVEKLLDKIRKEYEEHDIDVPPSVFIKNDMGTYGMAVIRVNSADDVTNMNVKMRKQMRVGKYSKKLSSVILQEGVITSDRIKGMVAEPVIYEVNNRKVGGFYRLNTEKGDTDNLNSKGMKFEKMCIHKTEGYENIYDNSVQLTDLIKVYDVIATIASIAAGYEIKEMMND